MQSPAARPPQPPRPPPASPAACGGLPRWTLVLLLAALLTRPDRGLAQPAADREPGKTPHEEVIVTAHRLTDEQMTQQVEKALADDPYIYAAHVSITTRNGIVICEGIVGDSAERWRVLRICRRASGSNRVINRLEINDNAADGG